MTKQDYRNLITRSTLEGYGNDRFLVFLGISICAGKEYGEDFMRELDGLYRKEYPGFAPEDLPQPGEMDF